MERRFTVDFSLETIFVVVASLFTLWLAFYLKDILILLLVAFIVASALRPAVNFFQRLKVPRILGTVLVYLIFIFVIFGMIRLLVPPLTEQVNRLYENRNDIVVAVNNLVAKAPADVKLFVRDYADKLPQKIEQIFSGQIVSRTLGVFSGLLGIATVLVATFYLLLEDDLFKRAINHWWPEKSRKKALATYGQVTQKIGLWARGQLVLSVSIGLLAFVGLSVLKIEYALTLALLAALGELIPIIGFWIALVPTLFIAFMMSPVSGFSVLVLYFGIQQFEAQILVPQVMKRAIGLSPIIIIFALLAGAKLLGILGVLIAIPVVSSISVILESFRPESQTKSK